VEGTSGSDLKHVYGKKTLKFDFNGQKEKNTEFDPKCVKAVNLMT